jgi:hypothetical protein
VVSGLAIILLAIFASTMIYRFVPGFGDEIANSRNNRLMQGAERKAAAVISSPATLVAQGIKTHSSRADNNSAGQASGARPSNPVSGGVAAHSTRTSTGGGSVPSATPPPRRSPAGTPHTGSTRNSSTNRSGGEGR